MNTQRDDSNGNLLDASGEGQKQVISSKSGHCNMAENINLSQPKVVVKTEDMEHLIAYSLQIIRSELRETKTNNQKLAEVVEKIVNIARDICALAEYEPPTLRKNKE
ncbi:hypothetical protein [Sporomusa sp.]|uniref:hypothetical protein n=1 Tax=Sporomusa sp. TaxID=2078658 RepID=UPI002C01D4AA|nr:hypothetical protein [Sporomusa sp.]HWR42091.1 hypothetical protein [Sporomusa sp.]